ncbi:MAG: exo-alpha-sialidase, partial [Thermoplasmata archaeon]|nr:exo-alpha-sialidase [Thermoplasmata archaeon]
MKRKNLITVQLVIFLVFIIAIPHPGAEARVEHVEKDFTVKTLPDSIGGGFEPHILAGQGIDGNQWYYVDSPTGLGSIQGGNLWISKDYGESWQWYDKDSIVGSSGDSYTATSKDGVIYYTDLYLASASVDFSLDGGETWIANPAASEYVLDDRQWLQTGPNSAGGENLYFSFNQIPSGLVMVKSQLISQTGGALDWTPCNYGLPISMDVGSRDNFVVDQNNGNLYLANYQSNGIYCYISKNEGDSFSSVRVFDETVHAKVQNTFMEIDVDTAGNVYMMWSSRDHIMIAISEDEGSSWEVKQVTESDGCRVFPWIAAGDEGRIAMA